MLGVQQWAEIRRLVLVEERSQREVARLMGVARDTVARAVRSEMPPKYSRAAAGSKLDLFKDWGDQPDLVEIAAAERLEAFLELLTHPGGRRLRELPEPYLLAQRLDIAHRQPADERADHKRLQRLGPQQLRGPGEQLRRERLRRLANLRDLNRQFALRGLQLPVAMPTSAWEP